MNAASTFSGRCAACAIIDGIELMLVLPSWVAHVLLSVQHNQTMCILGAATPMLAGGVSSHAHIDVVGQQHGLAM